MVAKSRVPQNLVDKVIIYSTGKLVFSYIPDSTQVDVIAERETGTISSLVLHEGRLLEADYDGRIFDVKTRDQVGTTQDGPICSLAVYQQRLVAAAQREIGVVSETDSSPVHAAVVYYVDNNEEIRIFGNVENEDGPYQLVVPAETINPALKFRRNSLNLAATKDALYLASENVVEVTSSAGTPPAPVTGWLGDSNLLVSNGSDCYVFSYHNGGTNPRGVELRSLPANKGTAYFWQMLSKIDQAKQWIGYPDLAALVDNTLVFTARNVNYSLYKTALFALELTEEMKTSKNGIRAKPKGLGYGNSLDRFGLGYDNPMVVVPRDSVEYLLK